MKNEKLLSVSAIKEGTVIDHIHAGAGLKIIKIFRLNSNETHVTAGFNLKSQSRGLKDIIKVEGVFLTEAQCGQIAVFAPFATVNVIQDYEVVKKFKVQMPEAIFSVLSCNNARCITNSQKVSTLFFIEENNSRVLLRCSHCEKLFSKEEIQEKQIL